MMQLINKMGITSRRVAGIESIMGQEHLMVCGLDKRKNTFALTYTTTPCLSEPSVFVGNATGSTAAVIASDAIADALFAALSDFKEARGTLPSCVIVYRAGVSEGQLVRIVEEEVERGAQQAFDRWKYRPLHFNYRAS
eukprot:g7591.t1